MCSCPDRECSSTNQEVCCAGKILTQGGVLATTYPEWIAEYMLSCSVVPLPGAGAR